MKVVLCWHMHQPYYRDELNSEYLLPWVYLHAMKDYSDMAWHLENHPDVRTVVNFSPVLLEQLTDYKEQLEMLLEDGTATRDHLLNLLAGTKPLPTSSQQRLQIIRDCQRCNKTTMINRWPAFRTLVNYARNLTRREPEYIQQGALSYLSEQYFYDLLMWYHIAWLGESLQKDDRVRKLIKKTSLFNESDRTTLLQIICETLSCIIPRYRALSESGQIELSMTPWGHPIVPLLHDFDNMQCSMPDAPRPVSETYPGGITRSRWHMQHGIEIFSECFGTKPAGVWLSEGSVSEDSLDLLDEFDIKWTASGETVWHNTAVLSQLPEADISSKRGLFSAYVHDGHKCRLFFRDDGLSDLIGFEYRNWKTEDAVANFGMHITNIHKFLGDNADNCVISVILDGENAWEYFPRNAIRFLDRFYQELEDNSDIETVTFSQVASELPVVPLKNICAGSWVYGSFSTWIGSRDKNRAWDLLVEAKKCFDHAITSGQLDAETKEQAIRQLAICEGSDWFWWFGDYNPHESVHDFDQLYRHQLSQLYQLINVHPPATLDMPLSRGSSQGTGDSGAMRRNR